MTERLPEYADVLSDPGAAEVLAGFELAETKSGYNNTISIWENQVAERRVARVLGNVPGSFDPQFSQLAPVLAGDRLDKEQIILGALKSMGFPVPICLYHVPSSNISVYEWAEGALLDFDACKQLPYGTRQAVGNKLGAFLGALHGASVNGQAENLLDVVPGKYSFATPKDKHYWRFAQSVAMLAAAGTLQTSESEQIASAGQQWLGALPASDFRLIHGDFYSRNIFINPATLDITAVIDWVDSAEIDDPLADVLLTAGWYAFDDNLTDILDIGNQAAFLSVLEGYGANIAQPEGLGGCIALFKIYSLLWHLRVLVAETVKGNQETIEQFKGTLASLLNVIERT